MKPLSLSAIAVLLCFTSLFGQRQSLTLKFTALDSSAYVQLDSIRILNRTQGGSTVITWPDTLVTVQINPGDFLLSYGYATFYPVGIQELAQDISSFRLYQNYPNPVNDRSLVSMSIPAKGTVHIMVSDLKGRMVVSTEQQLEKGLHTFCFFPGMDPVYYLTVRFKDDVKSIKLIIHKPETGRYCRLEYIGSGLIGQDQKKSAPRSGFVLHSGILDAPAGNKTYTFQFATHIPCFGTPTVEYGGQIYNTIQIYSQCWLKENLNVGTMVTGTTEMSDNSIIEKYCYEDNPDSCTTFGGLYQWNEMMQYVLQEGTQGICPPGWHLPTDEEWKVLEGAVDSQYGFGDPEWDRFWDYRGYNAGTLLRSTTGWYQGGNGSDLFGFSGQAAGIRDSIGTFNLMPFFGYFWTSTSYDSSNSWCRNLRYGNPGVYRSYAYKPRGFSVRCLRDE